MAVKALWQWESGVDLSKRKCAGCKGPMIIDRASAVSYKSDIWHAHCLLDMLTEYHSGSHSGNLPWNAP